MTHDKKTYEIKARTVIVSAGTWETPLLLLHSGIPGAAIGHYWYAYENKKLLEEPTFRFFGPGTMEARYENHVNLDPGSHAGL